MNRQSLGWIGGLAAAAVLWPASGAFSTIKMTTKQAVLSGVSTGNKIAPEQLVGRLIVRLREPSAGGMTQPMSASRVQALSATAGVGLKSMRALGSGASLMALDSPVPLSQARAVAERLKLDPLVAYAEPDILLKKSITPNETRFNEWQWNLFAPTTTYTGQIAGQTTTKSAPATGGASLPSAWDVSTGSNAVVVAIIDTGITNHPDLNGLPNADLYVANGRFLAGYDFISESVGAPTLPRLFVANDGDGRDPDPSDPGDWVTTQEETDYASQCDDEVTGPQDSSWHGTHMSGVAAATANNSLGIAGIGWNVRILPVRALGKCGGALSDIADAMRWAAGLPVPGVPDNPNPAQVLNLSLGSTTDATCENGSAMQSAVDAVIAAGALVVAATGNDGEVGLSVPAKCNGVIAVTAHTINGDNASYANIGAAGGSGPQPTLSAAGGGSPTTLGTGGATDDRSWFGYFIWSTILFGDTSPTSQDTASPPRRGAAYAGFTGTSAATPQVAGVAALLKSILPSASPATIRNLIVNNVRPHPAGSTCGSGGPLVGQCGAGLLDAQLAVRAAAPNAAPAAPPAAPPPSSAVPPTGGSDGGGGSLPLWQLTLLGALLLAGRIRR